MRVKALFAVLGAFTVLAGFSSPSYGQAPEKRPPIGPAAPQSTHHPVLLLAVGSDASWNLRIGPKGPERLDRPNYPPIPLEPGEVSRDGAAEAWTYHAKDLPTGGAVAVHLSREACSDATTTKYSFRAVVEHAQLGTLNGCARIAAELFPRVNNEDEDDTEKKKPEAETTVTNFKMPVDIAYIGATKKLVLRHGRVPHVVAPEGKQLALSHDGKRLLYTRGESGGTRAIVLYDSTTGKSADLWTGDVQQAFWSPDDTRIAFLKLVDNHWRLWVGLVATPESAAAVYQGDVTSIGGWTDAHTILVDDLQQASWVGDDGAARTTVSNKEIYGDSYGASSASTIRVHPLNPDLLLVSAEIAKPGSSAGSASAPGLGVFLYEIRSRRRTLLSPPEMLSQAGEWSRDGLQVFFTGTDSARRMATWRMFWDGTGLKRYLDGTGLVIGQ